MDLYYAPFNLVHELYYQAFMMREAREEERKKQEEEKANAEKEAKNNKRAYKPQVYNNRLSPAAQAKAINDKKFQDDENKKASEGNNNEPNISSPGIGVDPEDLVDLLEEGI